MTGRLAPVGLLGEGTSMGIDSYPDTRNPRQSTAVPSHHWRRD
mgnify:CR=1 FL=1